MTPSNGKSVKGKARATLAEEFHMRALRWVAAPMLLLGPALAQTDPSQVTTLRAVTEASQATESKANTPRTREPPTSTRSASQAGGYRRPQRFLRDTAPPLTKPVPLRLGTFSRKWARSGRETLAERRRLLWPRVKDARNGLPRRREVFQPASVRDKTSSGAKRLAVNSEESRSLLSG